MRSSIVSTIQERFCGWVSITHLHDDVMHTLHSGSCSQQKKNKMASHSGGRFTCCVPGCFSNSKRRKSLVLWFPERKKSCGDVGYTKYPRKISPWALDTRYVACISKGAKKPTWTMFLSFFLWQSPMQDHPPNQGKKSFLPGLQHLVNRHCLQPFQQLQAQQKLMYPRVVEHNNRLNDWEKNCKTSCA